MERGHIDYPTSLGLTLERVQAILDHLKATGQAWCLVDGRIIDRGFCERYIETASNVHLYNIIFGNGSN